jgi:hypothetical protein
MNAGIQRADGFAFLNLGKHAADVPASPYSDPSKPVSYLRADNWMAGTIRRAVAVGSPFVGSPLADVIYPKVANLSDDSGVSFTKLKWKEYVESGAPGSATLRRVLFPAAPPSGPLSVAQFVPPSCAYDLSTAGLTTKLLGGLDFDTYPDDDDPSRPPYLPVPQRHYFARYPSGQRSVPLFGMGGTMVNWTQAVDDWDGEENWVGPLVKAVAGTDAIMTAVSWLASGIGGPVVISNSLDEWAQTSDLIVPIHSQRAGTVQSEFAFRQEDPLMHFAAAGFEGETSSSQICHWVHHALYGQIRARFTNAIGDPATPSTFVPFFPQADWLPDGGEYVP